MSAQLSAVKNLEFCETLGDTASLLSAATDVATICRFFPQGRFGAFSAGNFDRFPTKNKYAVCVCILTCLKITKLAEKCANNCASLPIS
jgi:hypothetical protein